MNPQLRVLNAIASIMESAVIDYTGEAKGEIFILCGNLESNENFAIEGRHAVAEELEQIASMYRGNYDEKFKGSRRLGELSRRLWASYLIT
jgi:hypothetical protein